MAIKVNSGVFQKWCDMTNLVQSVNIVAESILNFLQFTKRVLLTPYSKLQ